LSTERKKLLETSTYRGAPRNPATVNRYFSSLSGALRYALRNLRWIDENPCLNLLKLKETPKERRVLTGDEEMRLLQACKESHSPYLYCITLIALTTGARKGEILALKWDCIDFEQRLAHIRDSKNGRPRRIALVDSVTEELRRLYGIRQTVNPVVSKLTSKPVRSNVGRAVLPGEISLPSYKINMICLFESP